MMQRATVYSRSGSVLMHASSRTTDGVWILSEPCLRLDDDSSNEELGEAVRRVLAGSSSPVRHPTQWKGLFEPMLRVAGVKSWKAFSKNTLCVQVELDGDRLELIPTNNLGVDEGFEPNEVKKKSATMPCGAEALGALVREAIAESNLG